MHKLFTVALVVIFVVSLIAATSHIGWSAFAIAAAFALVIDWFLKHLL